MPHPSTSSAYGIWSLNEVRDAVRGENWPSPAPTDPNFANVSLLLNGDGTSGSTSIVDLSNNALSLTIAGNTQIDTAVKKYGTGSIQFDGNADYIQLPNDDALSMGTGDFTIEFWVYSEASGVDGFFRRFVKLANDASSAIQIGHILSSAASNGFASYYASSGIVITGTTDIRNAWHHLALVRNSGTVTLYVDGTAEGTPITDTNNKVYNDPKIGSYDGTQGDMQGYIDDLRITKGVARYTANFTPPTEALPTE